MSADPRIAPARSLDIDAAEHAFNAHARKAGDAPHLWGEAEEAELARFAAACLALYERDGLPEDDRIVL